MINFYTSFDRNFMIHGLTMYRSLEQHYQSFHLYIFAFDELIIQKFTSLNLTNATIISLKNLENETLLSVKHKRTIGEYCWTTTPFTILYCLQNYQLDSCIYLDADLLFFNNPKILIQEVPPHKSVLITAHRFSTQCAHLIQYGIYNVQFMYFKHTKEGLDVLNMVD